MASELPKVENVTPSQAIPIESKLEPLVVLPRQYTFKLIQFRITNTRSLHEDTDYATISARVGDQFLTKTQFVGDVNNGYHPLQLEIGPFTMYPQDTVTFAYYIVNRGHSSDSSGATVDKLTAAAGAVLSEVPGADEILAAVDGILHAIFDLVDCDGTVAAAKFTWPRQFLDDETLSGPVQSVWRHHPGTDSDVGCGSNSEYDVLWEIQRD